MKKIALFTGLTVFAPFAVNSAGEELFFRAACDSPSIISDFSDEGVLQWSNVVDTGQFLIERSEVDTTFTWTPYMRGVITNHVTSSKVHEFSPPERMQFIPGGTFTMGDAVGDHSASTPLHTVFLDPFFMGENKITNQEMKEVLQWAYDQGLVVVETVPPNGPFGGRIVRNTTGTTNDLFGLDEFAEELDFVNGMFEVKVVIGVPKENFPCVYVSWYGSVAYCHYRSLMEGKESCFDLSDWSCDFSKKGYRLPTEAEWELAARGGYEGMRFPWGDTNVVTHSRANYRSDSNFFYDVSPTRGQHPDYVSQPLESSPIGAFPPNGYGLYDMCGNVWDWVWDWAQNYSSATQTNPAGPATGTFKIFRGGSNFTTAERTTCAVRFVATHPSATGFDIGFRIAMTY
jgi:formylglycine-generating enzyme required for sulfatase activity